MASKHDLSRLLEALDAAQTAGDLVGIADPTGFVDAGNAAVSLVRAIVEPQRRKEHLFNAAVSTAGVFPYVGDLAKGLKIPGAAVKGAARASRGSRGARAAGEVGEEAVEAGAAGKSGIRFQQVVAHGRNFGDILGGKKSPQEARDEMEAHQREQQVKKNLSDTVVGLTGVFGSLTVGSIALVRTVEGISAAMVERQRDISQYSGQMSFAAARLDMGRLQRSIMMAGSTDDTFADLAEQVNELEKSTNPYKALRTNVENKITEYGTWLQNILIKGVETLTPLDEIVDKLNKWLDEEGKGATVPPAIRLLEDIAAGRVAGSKAKKDIT